MFLRYQVFFGLFFFFIIIFLNSLSPAFLLLRLCIAVPGMAGNAQELLNQWSLQYLCSWCFSQCSSPECMALSQGFAQVTGVSQTGGFFLVLPTAPKHKKLHVLGLVKLLCVLRRGLSKISPSLHNYKVVCMLPVVRVQCSILWFLLL